MKIDVSGRKFSFPHNCVCCCGEPSQHKDISTSKSRGKTKYTQTWSVPYCQHCVGHVDEHNIGAAVIMLGISVAILTAFWIGWWSILFIILSIMLGWNFMEKAKKMRKPQCASTAFAARYLGWHGTLHSFDFVSVEYARLFLHANTSKLVNLSIEQIKILENYDHVRRGITF